MKTARTQLTDLIHGGAYDQPYAHVLELQRAAADELFQLQRPRIGILDQRARDAGIERIGSLRDIVPLLFSHTTYKSYPQSFVDKGQWDKMLRWLGTLMPIPIDHIDVSSVRNVDDWVNCLRDAGVRLYASSGTSGRCSFVPVTASDRDKMQQIVASYTAWPNTPKADRSRRLYQLGAGAGPARQIDNVQMLAASFAKPGDLHYLSDEPLSIAFVNRHAAMRRAIAEGTATPDSIAAYERESADRAERMQRALDAIAEDIYQHRAEPLLLTGPPVQHWYLLQRLRAKGMKDGTLNPNTVVSTGGGLKGAAVPDDATDQVMRFYTGVYSHLGYGMSELSSPFPRCEAGRYHCPPWIVILLLDRNGETLLNAASGIVEGRAAFLDLLYEGRWGGLISGDKLRIDFSARCECGRPGPSILDGITRYTDVGDDKITCADTIDAYIRGAVEA